MISKRYPWRLFILSFLTQLFVFNSLFLLSAEVLDSVWNLNFLYITLVSSLISTLLFMRPVYLLVISLKDKKADWYREREESQAFLGAIQEAVVTFNLQKQIVFFNPQFAANFIGSSNSSKKRYMDQIFDQKEVLSAIEEVLKTGSSQKVILRLPTLFDSNSRFFNISLAPVRKQKNQELYEVVAVFYDITDIKKAEQIRIDFVGNASHELRTPLTSIKGYVETLRDDIENKRFDQADRFITIVSRNVDRLIDLVNDLLNLTKMESSSDLRVQSFNPIQISQAVIGELMLLAQEKNLVLKSTSEIHEMKADSQKVEQVLRNLISNAIKYIPESKEIHVNWKTGPQEIQLIVSDNGPGIPEEHHARLFERFYRIDRGRSREMGGTGLGLAIVKHIMQSHRGSIEVRSKPGEGTTFICHFPQTGWNFGP